MRLATPRRLGNSPKLLKARPQTTSQRPLPHPIAPLEGSRRFPRQPLEKTAEISRIAETQAVADLLNGQLVLPQPCARLLQQSLVHQRQRCPSRRAQAVFVQLSVAHAQPVGVVGHAQPLAVVQLHQAHETLHCGLPGSTLLAVNARAAPQMQDQHTEMQPQRSPRTGRHFARFLHERIERCHQRGQFRRQHLGADHGELAEERLPVRRQQWIARRAMHEVG